MRLRFIVLGSLFCLFMLFTSVSFCANYNQFNGSFDFKEVFDDMKSIANFSFNFDGTTSQDNYNNFYDNLLNNNYTYICLRGVDYGDTKGTFVFYGANNIKEFTNVVGGTKFLGNYKQIIMNKSKFNNESKNTSCSIYDTTSSKGLNVDPTNSYTNKFYFLKIDDDYYYFTNGIYADYVPIDNTRINFIPYNNNVQNILGIPFHIENFSRSVSSWRLGTLENFNDFSKGYIDIFNGSN